MKILGISSFYHDSSASLLVDGKIVSAVQEERFTRIKHDFRFPSQSINYILKENKIRLNDVDYIVFYEKPFLKFERLIETYLAFVPKGFKSFKMSMPVWVKEKLFHRNIIKKKLLELDKTFDKEKKIFFSEHHLSHAASAFYPSPFNESCIVTLDGVGEWETTTIALGKNNNIEMLENINFPHSVGLLYSAFTYFMGFKVNSGEYKLMGLAPYGEPIYTDKIRENLIDLKEDGSFRLNMQYFDFATGLTMTNEKFNKLFSLKPRKNEDEKITKKHMDLAASIQKVTEEIVMRICKYGLNQTNQKNLCLAGGVALNCVANGKILTNLDINSLWIQPAAGDAGGSLGAALAFWYLELKKKRDVDNSKDYMNGSLLGPKYKNDQIEKVILNYKNEFLNFKKYENEDELISIVASKLSEGKSVGWFQGRMEFGPRALGSRSILADPRNISMQKELNLKIKYRESFRPFAPIVLEKYAKEWFDLEVPSRYMLLTSKVNKTKLMNQMKTSIAEGFEKLKIKRSEIPAVTHVDNSARVQTVDMFTNNRLYKLLIKFYEITSCPVLINTSFNVRGEPIVCNPEDAIKCFLSNELDILVCEDFFIYKEENFKTDTELSHRFEKD